MHAFGLKTHASCDPDHRYPYLLCLFAAGRSGAARVLCFSPFKFICLMPNLAHTCPYSLCLFAAGRFGSAGVPCFHSFVFMAPTPTPEICVCCRMSWSCKSFRRLSSRSSGTWDLPAHPAQLQQPALQRPHAARRRHSTRSMHSRAHSMASKAHSTHSMHSKARSTCTARLPGKVSATQLKPQLMQYLMRPMHPMQGQGHPATGGRGTVRKSTLDTSPLAEWGDEPASMHTSHEPASKHASQPTWPHAPAAAGQRQSVHNSTTHTLDNYLGQWGSAVPLNGQPVGEQHAQREQQGPQQGPQDAQYSQHDQYAPQHAQHGQHGSHHAQLPNMGGKSWADSFMDDGEAWGSDTGAQAGLLPLNEPAGQQVSTVLSRAIFLLVFLLIFCEQEYH